MKYANLWNFKISSQPINCVSQIKELLTEQGEYLSINTNGKVHGTVSIKESSDNTLLSFYITNNEYSFLVCDIIAENDYPIQVILDEGISIDCINDIRDRITRFADWEYITITSETLLIELLEIIFNCTKIQKIIKNITNFDLIDSSDSTTVESELELYYQYYKNDFEKIRNDSLLGHLSSKESYIELFTESQGVRSNLKDVINQWVAYTPYGVTLIHGQPGNGKTTFCKKMLYDYIENKSCDNAIVPVFLFSLNTAKSPIIEDGILDLQRCFCRPGSDKDLLVTFDDCRNSLVFLDGYDEMKTKANETKYTTLNSFLELVNNFADKYNIHFVITSRTAAIANELHSLSQDIHIYKIANMTEAEQYHWITLHSANNYLAFLSEYWDSLKESISDSLKEMLGIHIIFRLVVNAKYIPESKTMSIAKLYHDLFTLCTSKYYDTDLLEENYEYLAYQLFEANEDYIETTNIEDYSLLYAYYTDLNRNEIGFIHRSFYQYFLAGYLYHTLEKVNTTDKATQFLKLLWCRRIDQDTLFFLDEIANEQKDEHSINKACELVLKVLNETSGILHNLSPSRKESDTSEADPLLQCGNIFVNGLNICCRFNTINYLNASDQIKRIIKNYDCSYLDLSFSRIRKKYGINELLDFRASNWSNIVLYEANLQFVDLSYSDLSNANLRLTNLQNSNLNNCYLLCADMDSCNLSQSTLINAKISFCFLHDADFTFANLTGSSFFGSELFDTLFNNADLQQADFRRTNHEDALWDNANMHNTIFE